MDVSRLRGRRLLRKRSWAMLAAAVAVGLASATVLMVGVSQAVTGSPSGFESSDGNMVLNNLDGTHTDWNCFLGTGGFQPGTPNSQCAFTTGATQITADLANGEVTWVNGQKFDAACPALQTGNVPNKDDFTNVASFNDTASNLDTYFYGATIRAVANGNSSGDVEFNQNPVGSNGTTSAGCRTAGDRLLAYDYLNGGTSLDFHLLTWIDSVHPDLGGNSGTCYVSHDSLPCWGANAVQISSALFDGQSNQSVISAADNGISGTDLAVNQFAEFGINLTQALNLSGECFAFPQEVWESRSSGSSFTSNPEDIEIEHHEIQNCGTIKVIKQTDPRGQDQVFSFTSNLPANATAGGVACTGGGSTGIQSNGSFCLNDAGNSGTANSTGNTIDTGATVLEGSYTVSEGSEPSGFTFETANCTVAGTGGSTASTSVKTATINLKPGDTVTCTYVNQQNTATMSTETSTTVPVFPSTAVHDTATVTGNQPTDTPSGTVTFFLCGPIPTGSCTSGGSTVGTGTLSGSGGSASATSPDVNTSASPLAPGRYCFRAEWPGDTNYPTALTEFGGANGTNECFTVQTIATGTVTTPSVGSGGTTTFGSHVTDHAVVTATQNGGGSPTGTVTFYVCDPNQVTAGTCSVGGTQVGSPVTTTDLGTTPPSASADSSAVTVNQTGTWCFRAVYTPGGANGANYIGSSDATSGECFTVTDSTGSTSAQKWLPNDTATVTAAHGAPLNGTLSAQLYTGATCAAGGTAVSGQSYSKTLTNATSAADTTLTTDNTSYFVSTSTSVSWLVTFTSSDPNVTGSSHCESTDLTITN